MGVDPDEHKRLPPPGIVNATSMWFAGVGWFSAVLQNAFKQRPPVLSGVHRQVLMATVGWFIGYHLTKRSNYVYAKLDREMIEYIRLHPQEFAAKERRTYAEIVEPFHPVR